MQQNITVTHDLSYIIYVRIKKKNNIDRVLEAGEEEDGGHTHIEHGTIDDYQN